MSRFWIVLGDRSYVIAFCLLGLRGLYCGDGDRESFRGWWLFAICNWGVLRISCCEVAMEGAGRVGYDVHAADEEGPSSGDPASDIPPGNCYPTAPPAPDFGRHGRGNVCGLED